VRTVPAGGKAVVVALNMTAQPQKIALDLKPAGISQRAVRTLLTNEASLQGVTTTSMTLPPFASWVGEVR
jgi:alpha-glucosidase